MIDGLVSSDVVELLVAALPQEEGLTLCGTGVDPPASELLRQLRPGSRLRKIRVSILAEYQQQIRWRPLPAEARENDGDPGMEPTAEATGAPS